MVRRVEIRVRNNGTGVPASKLFFTNTPSGEGTARSVDHLRNLTKATLALTIESKLGHSLNMPSC